MSHNIVKDLTLVTNIPKSIINKLVNLVNDCICHCIKEEIYESSNVVDLDIGIGHIAILLEDNSVRYKFTPSKSLEDKIRWTITSKSSIVEVKAKESLRASVLNSYKGIL